MSSLSFRPITLEARQEILPFTLSAKAPICDLSFANLYGWSLKYSTSYAIAGDHLFIRFSSPHRSHPAYLLPLSRSGACITSSLELLKDEAKQGGYPLVVMGITALCREHLEAICPETFTFLEDEGAADYIYLREKLVTLSGKSLQSKRNHINKFEKLYPDYVYEPLSEANLPECLRMEELWLDQHGAEEDEEQEREVIQRLLKDFSALQLSGGLLRVGGEVVAFTLGSPINADTFDVHIEKANRDYEGAYTMINRCFSASIPEQYTYINREEDLGIEGLRKAKLSYKPELVLQKIAAVLRHDCPIDVDAQP